MRWSDGSLQLMIGDEVLDVAELDIDKDNNYLFLRHVQAQFLEVCSMQRSNRQPDRILESCYEACTHARMQRSNPFSRMHGHSQSFDVLGQSADNLGRITSNRGQQCRVSAQAIV